VKKFELARRARGGLEDIWEFDEFHRAFDQLAEMPGMGHRRRDLTNRDVLFWPVHSYLITCQPASPLRIVRVVHGRRDLKKLLRRISG